jgi:hypothetical protein
MMIRKLIQTTLCAFTLAIASPLAFAAPKLPTTAEDHFALAKQYEEQATTYRKQAQEHRDMAEAFRKANLGPRKGWDSTKNKKVEAMDKHCDDIAKAEDNLASQDQKAAEYHTFRGKELQGK